MRRREFIAGLGSVGALPVAARAQQEAVQVIGYLDAGSLETRRDVVEGVHRGLAAAGYVVGRNVTFEYRWAEDHLERLPALAADLVRRQVAVIVTPGSTQATLAAKAASGSIPIVFLTGADPVEIGLVASLNRPGGNLTGLSSLNVTLAAKRLELLHELVPTAASIGNLVNPTNPVFSERETQELQVASRILGVRLLIVRASDPSQFEPAFESLVRNRTGGLLIGGDTLFVGHTDQLVALAARHRVPVIYRSREATAEGGLLSYGTDFPAVYQQVGVYVGRILKGEKPADLPVQQITKMQLVVNLKTAKALGLTIPETLLATADEVIQ